MAEGLMGTFGEDTEHRVTTTGQCSRSVLFLGCFAGVDHLQCHPDWLVQCHNVWGLIGELQGSWGRCQNMNLDGFWVPPNQFATCVTGILSIQKQLRDAMCWLFLSASVMESQQILDLPWSLSIVASRKPSKNQNHSEHIQFIPSGCSGRIEAPRYELLTLKRHKAPGRSCKPCNERGEPKPKSEQSQVIEH